MLMFLRKIFTIFLVFNHLWIFNGLSAAQSLMERTERYENGLMCPLVLGKGGYALDLDDSLLDLTEPLFFYDSTSKKAIGGCAQNEGKWGILFNSVPVVVTSTVDESFRITSIGDVTLIGAIFGDFIIQAQKVVLDGVKTEANISVKAQDLQSRGDVRAKNLALDAVDGSNKGTLFATESLILNGGFQNKGTITGAHDIQIFGASFQNCAGSSLYCGGVYRNEALLQKEEGTIIARLGAVLSSTTALTLGEHFNFLGASLAIKTEVFETSREPITIRVQEFCFADFMHAKGLDASHGDHITVVQDPSVDVVRPLSAVLQGFIPAPHPSAAEPKDYGIALISRLVTPHSAAEDEENNPNFCLSWNLKATSSVLIQGDHVQIYGNLSHGENHRTLLYATYAMQTYAQELGNIIFINAPMKELCPVDEESDACDPIKAEEIVLQCDTNPKKYAETTIITMPLEVQKLRILGGKINISADIRGFNPNVPDAQIHIKAEELYMLVNNLEAAVFFAHTTGRSTIEWSDAVSVDQMEVHAGDLEDSTYALLLGSQKKSTIKQLIVNAPRKSINFNGSIGKMETTGKSLLLQGSVKSGVKGASVACFDTEEVVFSAEISVDKFQAMDAKTVIATGKSTVGRFLVKASGSATVQNLEAKRLQVESQGTAAVSHTKAKNLLVKAQGDVFLEAVKATMGDVTADQFAGKGGLSFGVLSIEVLRSIVISDALRIDEKALLKAATHVVVQSVSGDVLAVQADSASVHADGLTTLAVVAKDAVITGTAEALTTEGDRASFKGEADSVQMKAIKNASVSGTVQQVIIEAPSAHINGSMDYLETTGAQAHLHDATVADFAADPTSSVHTSGVTTITQMSAPKALHNSGTLTIQSINWYLDHVFNSGSINLQGDSALRVRQAMHNFGAITADKELIVEAPSDYGLGRITAKQLQIKLQQVYSSKSVLTSGQASASNLMHWIFASDVSLWGDLSFSPNTIIETLGSLSLGHAKIRGSSDLTFIARGNLSRTATDISARNITTIAGRDIHERAYASHSSSRGGGWGDFLSFWTGGGNVSHEWLTHTVNHDHASGSILSHAGGSQHIEASQKHAASTTVSAVGNVIARAVYDQHNTVEKVFWESGMWWWYESGHYENRTSSSTPITPYFGNRTSTTVTSQMADVFLEGVRFNSPNIKVNAQNGRITFASACAQIATCGFEEWSNFLWQSQSQWSEQHTTYQGCSSTSPVHCTAKDGVDIHAVQGDILSVMATHLRHHPLYESHFSHFEKQEGPSVFLSAMVGVMMSLATGGTASALGASFAAALGTTGTMAAVVGSATAGAIMATATAIPLGILHSNGDIGNFKINGKDILIGAMTAGAAEGYMRHFNIRPSAFQRTFAENLKVNAVRTATSFTANTMFYGFSEEQLHRSLLSVVVDSVCSDLGKTFAANHPGGIASKVMQMAIKSAPYIAKDGLMVGLSVGAVEQLMVGIAAQNKQRLEKIRTAKSEAQFAKKTKLVLEKKFSQEPRKSKVFKDTKQKTPQKDQKPAPKPTKGVCKKQTRGFALHWLFGNLSANESGEFQDATTETDFFDKLEDWIKESEFFSPNKSFLGTFFGLYAHFRHEGDAASKLSQELYAGSYRQGAKILARQGINLSQYVVEHPLEFGANVACNLGFIGLLAKSALWANRALTSKNALQVAARYLANNPGKVMLPMIGAQVVNDVRQGNDVIKHLEQMILEGSVAAIIYHRAPWHLLNRPLSRMSSAVGETFSRTNPQVQLHQQLWATSAKVKASAPRVSTTQSAAKRQKVQIPSQQSLAKRPVGRTKGTAPKIPQTKPPFLSTTREIPELGQFIEEAFSKTHREFFRPFVDSLPYKNPTGFKELTFSEAYEKMLSARSYPNRPGCREAVKIDPIYFFVRGNKGLLLAGPDIEYLHMPTGYSRAQIQSVGRDVLTMHGKSFLERFNNSEESWRFRPKCKPRRTIEPVSLKDFAPAPQTAPIPPMAPAKYVRSYAFDKPATTPNVKEVSTHQAEPVKLPKTPKYSSCAIDKKVLEEVMAQDHLSTLQEELPKLMRDLASVQGQIEKLVEARSDLGELLAWAQKNKNLEMQGLATKLLADINGVQSNLTIFRLGTRNLTRSQFESYAENLALQVEKLPEILAVPERLLQAEQLKGALTEARNVSVRENDTALVDFMSESLDKARNTIVQTRREATALRGVKIDSEEILVTGQTRASIVNKFRASTGEVLRGAAFNQPFYRIVYTNNALKALKALDIVSQRKILEVERMISTEPTVKFGPSQLIDKLKSPKNACGTLEIRYRQTIGELRGIMDYDEPSKTFIVKDILNHGAFEKRVGNT